MKNFSPFKLICIALLISTFLDSCNFNATYINRDSDRADGERITTLFFEDLKRQQYDDSFKYIDERFFKVTSKEKVLDIYKTTLKKLGKLDSTRVLKWETRQITGTNARTEYQFFFLNHYTNYTANETIGLLMENNGPIKIVSYNINSDGFFK